MRQRTLSPIAVAVLSSALFLAGCSNGEEGQQAQAGQQQQQTVGVVTIAPQEVDLQVKLPGRATAFRSAEVRPQVSGIIEQQLFTEGSTVSAGQSLYQIDPATYAADVSAAEAAVAQAEANLHAATARFERFQELLAGKAVSQQEFDEAQAAYLQARATLKTAQAQLQRAEVNLEYTKVKAPISGRIGRSLLTEGALVNVAQAQPLATIHQLDPIYVDIQQSSEDYLDLQQAIASGRIVTDGLNRAAVKLYANGGSEVIAEGQLLFNEVTVQPSTSSITLRAKFANADMRILPGMYVTAEVETGTLTGAILAPQEGVNRDPRGRAVAMVVNSEGKVEQRYLTLGATSNGNWVVRSGLSAGDKVIVEGLQKIQPGAAVQTEEVK
ncbi:efflux RND transporter periplasmic adaptor subunit [Pseudidiomarina insulisalsae]|uniref:Efflux transporter periplasmic adaptor subunit n=1 Tax=Pseudidiomarina insulisalsae TaxID=575789 RepID=A0A432YH16_9GAMM|nr:efflux RND transporter periplasmic adaptor subunit [Pseudidiomarina insulisalsae]RUO60238.1 efflux transporter periplasmic adaptor subunit [Pseudidiomarina insulisalsae]